MAGYRRFVIYLYWCQKENVQNVGFAKIELQNNQCRIEMHLKGLPQREQTLPVYLFNRDENSADKPVLWGVELGKVEIKRGIGKFGRIFSIEKIGGSPFCYQDMNGILIPLNTDEMVAGQWDNKDIIQQQFRVWSLEAERSASETEETSKESVGSESETLVKESIDAESERAAKERVDAESERAAKERVGAEPERAAKESTSAEPERAAKESTSVESERAAEVNSDNASEPVVTEYTATAPDSVLEEGAATAKDSAAVTQESSPEKEKTQADGKDTLHMQQLAYDFEERGFQKKEQKKNFTQETASDWEQMWKMLSSRREAFAPMEGKDVVAVRIDLKDLHYLPEDLWNLGNNSFLLHGFFNYRFLLYGKICQENGAPYYFIGIPGVFSNQEKVLAAIFGFPEFYLEKKAEFQTGKSGYWCKLLMSSDNNAYK